MGLLARLFLGDGSLSPSVRAELEAEALVLLEEGLRGTVRYTRFKMPGRRFYGKVTPERLGLGISEKRFVIYCRSGKAKLMDTAFTDPGLGALDVNVDASDAVAFRVDYDRLREPTVSGQVTIRARTPNASAIVQQLRDRMSGESTDDTGG